MPIVNGQRLYETLGKLGMDVRGKAYEDGGHWINEPQGVDDIGAFLHQSTFGVTTPALRHRADTIPQLASNKSKIGGSSEAGKVAPEQTEQHPEAALHAPMTSTSSSQTWWKRWKK